MPIAVNGSGTITGISVGGLPDGCVDTDTLATSVTRGKILQVVQTVKTDTASITNATYADISGLTATITPSSTSNKILVTFVLQYGGHNNSYVAFKAYRGSTLLPVGTSGTGNMSNVSFGGFQEQGNSQFGVQTAVWQYLDSPSSTSALTYKLQWASVYQPGGNYYIYLNRPQNADNNAYNIFGVSSVTAQEVAA
jgi:hypothetical protein|tara:strand:+ start:235 stop:819 length:585 start_codon:yes stop_codon:yes gene_type:complete